ncbi:hypothetical protein ABZ313_23990 [Streptomyces sp. NPDC006251]|uniref:hypothetical protein n=1 Tax=Streptomyces sp. NPDC006251 TaxID=3155718 RepID=UPI0033A73614
MIKRRSIALAAATALLGGLGAYGAATAFAASPSPEPQPTVSPSASASPDPDGRMNKEQMIRHCTDQLPADERDEARRQMDKMMSGDMDEMMGGSMMGGGTDDMMSGSMMGGASEDDHHGMG